MPSRRLRSASSGFLPARWISVLSCTTSACGVRRSEVIADGGAADVESQPCAAAFETGEVARRGLGKVVAGQLHRVERQTRRQINEVGERHGRLRLALQVQILAKAVRRQA